MLYCIIVVEEGDCSDNKEDKEEDKDNVMPPKEKAPPAKKPTASVAGKPDQPIASKPPAYFLALTLATQTQSHKSTRTILQDHTKWTCSSLSMACLNKRSIPLF